MEITGRLWGQLYDQRYRSIALLELYQLSFGSNSIRPTVGLQMPPEESPERHLLRDNAAVRVRWWRRFQNISGRVSPQLSNDPHIPWNEPEWMTEMRLERMGRLMQRTDIKVAADDSNAVIYSARFTIRSSNSRIKVNSGVEERPSGRGLFIGAASGTRLFAYDAFNRQMAERRAPFSTHQDNRTVKSRQISQGWEGATLKLPNKANSRNAALSLVSCTQKFLWIAGPFFALQLCH
jgi:hypothetical protein